MKVAVKERTEMTRATMVHHLLPVVDGVADQGEEALRVGVLRLGLAGPGLLGGEHQVFHTVLAPGFVCVKKSIS